jgi:hypothetical protein
MDFVVCECYYHRLLTGEKIPAPVNVFWVNSPTTGLNYIKLVDPDAAEGSPMTFPLPPPPPGYWLTT